MNVIRTRKNIRTTEINIVTDFCKYLNDKYEYN